MWEYPGPRETPAASGKRFAPANIGFFTSVLGLAWWQDLPRHPRFGCT